MDPVDQFATISFGGDSEKEEAKVNDKYYNYYFNYFKEKFGVGEKSNSGPSPGTSKLAHTTEVPLKGSVNGQGSVKKPSLMLAHNIIRIDSSSWVFVNCHVLSCLRISASS